MVSEEEFARLRDRSIAEKVASVPADWLPGMLQYAIEHLLVNPPLLGEWKIALENRLKDIDARA